MLPRLSVAPGTDTRAYAFAKRLGFVMRPLPQHGLFPGSSVVEQPAVNRLVAGSNPARGATKIKDFCIAAHHKITRGQRPGKQLAAQSDRR